MTVRKSRSRKTRLAAAPTAGAFHDMSAAPAPGDLAAALGAAAFLWRRFTHEVLACSGPLLDEWSFSKVFGWTLRLKQPGRIFVHLTPGESQFLVSFALGEKACKAARTAGVPAETLAIIDAAPRYAEGRGVRIPVRTSADLEAVLAVARVKAANGRG